MKIKLLKDTPVMEHRFNRNFKNFNFDSILEATPDKDNDPYVSILGEELISNGADDSTGEDPWDPTWLYEFPLSTVEILQEESTEEG